MGRDRGGKACTGRGRPVQGVGGEVGFQADASGGRSAVRGCCFDQPVLEAIISVFGGWYSVCKYENKPIIDPWTAFVQIWRQADGVPHTSDDKDGPLGGAVFGAGGARRAVFCREHARTPVSARRLHAHPGC